MGYCGLASLKMVLDYYGISKIEDELAPLMDWDRDLGMRNLFIFKIQKPDILEKLKETILCWFGLISPEKLLNQMNLL